MGPLLISTTNQSTNHSPSLCESTNNTTNTKFIKNIYICIKPYYQMSSIKPLCLSTIPKALNGKDLTIYNFFSLSLTLITISKPQPIFRPKTYLFVFSTFVIFFKKIFLKFNVMIINNYSPLSSIARWQL